jgi:hypothetical protein
VVKEKAKLRDPLEIYQGRVPEHMKSYLAKNPRPRPGWFFQQTRDAQEADLMEEGLEEQAKEDPNSVWGLM